MIDSLGSIAQLEALRATNEANRVIGIFTGEITTRKQLGGYAPEEILAKYLFLVTDVYPRDKIIEMKRGNLYLRIYYDDAGETFEIEVTGRKLQS